MEDFKTLTVRALRELAKKHLGKGHTKLKTKDELVAALRRAAPKAAKSLASKVSAVTKRKRPSSKAKPTERPASTAAEASGLPAPEVRVVTYDRGDDARSPKERWGKLAAPKRTPEVGQTFGGAALTTDKPVGRQRPSSLPPLPLRPSIPVARRPEPVREGFFSSRNASRPPRAAAKKHVAAALQLEESLGDLPAAYGKEAAVLLVRDPQTMYFFWDLPAAQRLAAVAGLSSPKTLLRVFAKGRLVAEEVFSVEEHGHYLRGLPQGEPLRVEVHAIGDGGVGRKLAEARHEEGLPTQGPSEDLTVKFLRVDPTERLDAPESHGLPTAPSPTAAPVPSPHDLDELHDPTYEPAGSSEQAQRRRRARGIQNEGGEEVPDADALSGERQGPLGSSERVAWRRSPSGQN